MTGKTHVTRESKTFCERRKHLMEISSAHFLFFFVEALWDIVIQGSIPLLLSNCVASTDVK